VAAAARRPWALRPGGVSLILVSEFDFDLPPELIAQEPAPVRSGSRLLLLSRSTGALTHSSISALPGLLRQGDLLVFNDTRVFPARLLGQRVPSGGAVECLLVSRLEQQAGGAAEGELWEALVHPGQKLKPGARVFFDGPTPLHGEILGQRFFGRRTVRMWSPEGLPISEAVDRIGHMPLPPYIRRADLPSDRERYQTIFATTRGSIAAPTAGLHFTPQLLDQLRARGVGVATVTLHVGYGTFQPVRVERVDEHRVEAEKFEISDDTAGAVNLALDQGRRVIAVGTTTTRTLESVARTHGGRLAAGKGIADLFIYPGFEFRVLSGLLTNFHLPKSSLLMLVSAFGGRDPVLAAYREAVAAGYRFYSYGDAMLIA
jgi:S-adenosylmethionine:tRNA ribosyltransferase-isomerase